MLCWPLFQREMRANCKVMLIFCGVFTLYGAVIISMFDPKLGDALNAMAASMPELFAAFVMSNPGATMLEFLVNYLYGFLFLVFPVVMILILVNRLIVRYVDRGAMAWLLASPHSRRTLALTQGKTLGLLVLLLTVYATVMCLALSQLMFPGALETGPFLQVNVGLLGMLLFFAGLCFASACVFPESRFALGVGGGLCAAFLLIRMLGQVSEKLDFLRWLTPTSLFDAYGIAAGDPGALAQTGLLYLGAAALFLAGIWRFSRKDLCL